MDWEIKKSLHMCYTWGRRQMPVHSLKWGQHWVNMNTLPLIKLTYSWKVFHQVQSGHFLFQGNIWDFTSIE
jgi:hypothetical protein